ncbi:hypothetical protein Syun_018020 [Stephania yunnanensis]|uniref:Uncharacterized protein n=1 Tax=Stephania yunnanensis TaxID=152371 RepID=A0AAP0IRI3_9MAGN
MNFRSLDELWAFYMSQHSKPSTRRWHFAGTLTALLILISSIIFAWWVIFFVPIFGDYRPCEEYESKPYAVLEAPAEAVDKVEDLSEENRKNVIENTT